VVCRMGVIIAVGRLFIQHRINQPLVIGDANSTKGDGNTDPRVAAIGSYFLTKSVLLVATKWHHFIASVSGEIAAAAQGNSHYSPGRNARTITKAKRVSTRCKLFP